MEDDSRADFLSGAAVPRRPGTGNGGRGQGTGAGSVGWSVSGCGCPPGGRVDEGQRVRGGAARRAVPRADRPGPPLGAELGDQPGAGPVHGGGGAVAEPVRGEQRTADTAGSAGVAQSVRSVLPAPLGQDLPCVAEVDGRPQIPWPTRRQAWTRSGRTAPSRPGSGRSGGGAVGTRPAVRPSMSRSTRDGEQAPPVGRLSARCGGRCRCRGGPGSGAVISHPETMLCHACVSCSWDAGRPAGRG